MPDISIYKSNAELPAIYECQVRTFIRIEWPFDCDQNVHSPLKREMWHPIHIVLADGETVIGYTALLWMDLAHGGETYRAYGLASVLTFPAWRRLGYGKQLMELATRMMDEAGDADIGFLFTTEKYEQFYANAGWKYLPDIKMFYGDPDHPKQKVTFTMMRFMSPKGKAAEADFAHASVYFGPELW